MKATNTLFLLVLLLLSPRIVSAQDDVRQRKDSLLKVIANTQGEDKLNAYKNLHGIYFDELSDQESLERFLALSAAFFKEARNNNQTERQGRLLVTDMIALISLYQFDEADKRMPETIAFLKEHGLTEALYKAYKQWILSFCRRGQYEKALSVLQQIFQQANATNDSEGLFYADYLMGIVYMHQDRLDEAEKRYRQSIETGSKMDKQPDDLLDAYSELCNMLQVTERFDDFFLVAQQTESLLKQVEAKNPGKSYKIAQSNIWTLYAFAYDSMGNFDQTEIYCNKMDSVNKSPVSMGNTTFLRAHIWDARGEYTKALAYIDQAIDLDPTYLHARYTKVKILSHLEKAPRTYSETEKTVEYADSLRNSSFNKQLDELRTQYEVDKITTEKERNRNYFLFALGGCGLLAIALGIWIYYSRLVTKKNRTMVVQIKELQAEQQRRDEEMLRKTTFEMPETTYDFYPESRRDKLCLAIRDLLLKDKIYRNPTLNRDIMVEQLGTSKNLFIEAFQHCFNMPLADYINELRLNDAIALLEQSDLSIEELSEKAGFGSDRTFRRQFQDKYNMSPQNYRKLAKEKPFQ